MKILVVDDSKVMRSLVRRALRQAGHGDAEVFEAEDGAEAVEISRTESPDCVLADWNMPIMTGIEMLREMRATGDEVTVGFITSESSDEIKNEAMSAGASFLLAKPFQADDLEACLDGRY